MVDGVPSRKSFVASGRAAPWCTLHCQRCECDQLSYLVAAPRRWSPSASFVGQATLALLRGPVAAQQGPPRPTVVQQGAPLAARWAEQQVCSFVTMRKPLLSVDHWARWASSVFALCRHLNSIQCAVHGIDNLEHPEIMNHYIKLKDDIINWEHMNYPGGNTQIDILEENNKGVLSINVFEEIEFKD